MSILPKDVNRLIARTMHDYRMLADGDRILVAVSGGVDSLVLAWLLDHWRRKAPISYDLLAVHIDNGFDGSSRELVAAELNRLQLPCLIESTTFGSKALAAEDGKSICFHCARQRRSRLFELAREQGFNKIAFGHHKDDILETFFLNLLYGGNLSTMVPRQDFFGGNTAIIRPLAMLAKEEIIRLAETLDIKPVKNPCPQDSKSRRREIRNLLANIYRLDPRAKANMFAALANVRAGYLLDHPPGRTGGRYANHP